MAGHRVFVGIGSNIDPENNVFRALKRLAMRCRLVAVSTFYRTDPVGPPNAVSGPRFLNGVVEIETDLDAPTLKAEVLRTIERDLGRVRSADRYAPRPIDLDILLHDDAIIDMPGLAVPDPDIRRRAFIAAPLLELAPDLVLPDTGEPLADVVGDGLSEELESADAFTVSLKGRLGL